MRNNVRGKNKSFIPRVDKGRCCPLGGFDYKAVGVLKRYISDSGKIDSGKRSGNCAKCQRNLTLAIKRARHMALIPYASNHLYDTSLISLEKAKEEVAEPEKVINSNCPSNTYVGELQADGSWETVCKI